MLGGGVGFNFFECELKFPNIGIDDNDVSDKVRFLVKRCNLPASNIALISVPFRGRELKIAGERTFDTWTVTVMNDGNFTLRDAFEKWMNLINRVSDNGGEVDPTVYQQEAYVHQLGRTCYFFLHCSSSNWMDYSHSAFLPVPWGIPNSGCTIELSYDQNNVIEEFTALNCKFSGGKIWTQMVRLS